jgi:hypothetical protein
MGYLNNFDDIFLNKYKYIYKYIFIYKLIIF